MSMDKDLDQTIARPTKPNPYDLMPQRPAIEVWSQQVTHGQPLLDEQVAALGNTSPHLAWEGAPEGTGSYVVTCFDPDAPTPSGFWHWAVVDIPGDCTELIAGAGDEGGTLPGKAFMLRNDGGSASFMGAAPPPNDQPHRYFFAVHSVASESLGIDAEASSAVLSFNLAFKATGRGYIYGTYEH